MQIRRNIGSWQGIPALDRATVNLSFRAVIHGQEPPILELPDSHWRLTASIWGKWLMATGLRDTNSHTAGCASANQCKSS